MSASIEQVSNSVRSLTASATSSAGQMQGAAASIQAVAGTMQEVSTSTLQVATSIAQSTAATKTIGSDTEELTGARERDRGGDRADVAVYRRRCEPFQRPRCSRRGDIVVDQRDGGVDRRGRRDGRKPRDRGRPELDVGRADASVDPDGRGERPQHHRPGRLIGVKRRADGAQHGVGRVARTAGRRGDAPRVPGYRGRRCHGPAIDAGHLAAARLDDPVGHGDPRDGAAAPARSAASWTRSI